MQRNDPFRKTFSIPISKSRHGYFGPVVNKNFFDLRLNLEKFKGKNIDVLMQGRINKDTNLAYEATNKEIKDTQKIPNHLLLGPPSFLMCQNQK